MIYDVIIAGAGPVGASLAVALRDSGLKIAIIEPVVESSAQQPSYDGRSLVLNHVSNRILEGIGLWSGLAGQYQTVEHIHVSRQGRFGVARIHAGELQVAALGYVVEAAALGQALRSAVQQSEDIDFFCPARVSGLEYDSDHVRVALNAEHDGKPLCGRVLVAADGARSGVRTLLDIGIEQTDYVQTAVVTTVSGVDSERAWAYERFTSSGPLALLPRVGGRFGVVWSVPSGSEDRILEMDDVAFVQHLHQAFGSRAGTLRRPGRRASYPLKLQRAATSLARRCVLLGNASHAVHPVAGQGFNLGLRDVAWLAQTLVDARQRNEDPGCRAVLHRYQNAREADQRHTLRFTDTLIRVFCNEDPMLASLGGLGLALTDIAIPMKRWLARGAMGYRGPASRLARGTALLQSTAP